MSVVLGTKVRPGGKTFAANEAAHRALLDDLRAQLERARAGGGPQAAERHRARGKLLARERVRAAARPRARRSSSSRRSRRTASTTAPRPAPGSSRASGACTGARS